MGRTPKISVCIPQFNRIEFLLKNLQLIALQTYDNIEVVISDDCSTDNTKEAITNILQTFKYPIVYEQQINNVGYDRNFRRSVELATGDYAIILGNDDCFYFNESIGQLVTFITQNDNPDIGFCNMIEEKGNVFVSRARDTRVIGSGTEIALRYYSCFSFVGGIIFKREKFLKFNTAKFDGSIYSQIYLAVLMISSGCLLFSIKDPLIVKDMIVYGRSANSYKDNIAKEWKKFKVVDGGLPSVMNVIINALKDAAALTQKRTYYIFRRMYLITFPQWILDYKGNHALPEAIGLIIGMNPIKNINFRKLSLISQLSIFLIYIFVSFLALLTPFFVFKKMEKRLYTYFKK